MESLLRRWREQQAALVALGELRTDVGLQARSSELVPFRDRARHEASSSSQVTRMRAVLTAFASSNLEPLLIANIDGGLYVVDGHHRLEAYRLAGRAEVPVRIKEVTRETAVMVSKFVNCGGEHLPMHVDQYRDAAWQYLAHVTLRGTLPLPKGVTCRSVAATFGGMSHDTISRMKRMLASVDLSQFTQEACDPATGWPRWRFVRGNAWRDCFNDIPLDQRKRVQAARLAKRIGDLRDKNGPEVFHMAIDLLLADREDSIADQRERLAQLADLDPDLDSPDSDY